MIYDRVTMNNENETKSWVLDQFRIHIVVIIHYQGRREDFEKGVVSNENGRFQT